MEFIQDMFNRSEGRRKGVSIDGILKKLRIAPFYGSLPDSSSQIFCSFAKCANNGYILASGNESGHVLIQNTASRSDVKATHIHKNTVFSIAWPETDMKIITGSGDHHIGLWDVAECGTLTCVSSFYGHQGSIKSVSFKPLTSAVFASGSRDGAVNIYDTRNLLCKPDIYIKGAHSGNAKGSKCVSVTSVLFQDDNYLLTTGDTDPSIKVWDLRRSYYVSNRSAPVPAFELSDKSDINKKGPLGHIDLAMNSCRSVLFAYGTDDTIYSYPLGTWQQNACYRYRGHKGTQFYLKCVVSPDDQYLACTDSENRMFIWKIGKSSEPLLHLTTTYEGAAGLDWDRSGDIKIAMCTDYEHPLIWCPRQTDDHGNAINMSPSKEVVCDCYFSDPSMRVRRKWLFDSELQGFFASADKTVSDLLRDLPDSVLHGRYSLRHQCKLPRTVDTAKRKGLDWFHDIRNKKKIKLSQNEQSTSTEVSASSPPTPCSARKRSSKSVLPSSSTKRKKTEETKNNNYSLLKFFKSPP